MKELGIVATDVRGRVSLQGSGHGVRFRLLADGEDFLLKRVPEEPVEPFQLTRNARGYLEVDGRATTAAEVKKLMEDWP